MIPRYTRPEMAAIWDPQTRYRIWFEIEAHAADAMAELGIIPKAAAKAIWDKGKHAKFDIARIEAIERDVKMLQRARQAIVQHAVAALAHRRRAQQGKGGCRCRFHREVSTWHL